MERKIIKERRLKLDDKGKRLVIKKTKVGKTGEGIPLEKVKTKVLEVRIEEVQIKTQTGISKTLEVYTDGYAKINKEKIDIYARGHVQQPVNYKNRGEIIGQFEKLQKESPNSIITKMQKEYDSFIRQIHNYERSLGNKKVLVAAGIPDTQENNKIIAAELLKSGKEVCEGNTKIQSELLINERKIILES